MHEKERSTDRTKAFPALLPAHFLTGGEASVEREAYGPSVVPFRERVGTCKVSDGRRRRRRRRRRSLRQRPTVSAAAGASSGRRGGGIISRERERGERSP
jgi:hypothetical protein